MKALLKKSAILKTISSKISTYALITMNTFVFIYAPHRIFQMHCKALQKPMRLPPLGPLMSR